MQRWSTIALGGLVLLALLVVLWKGGPRPVPEPERPTWSAALSASARPLALSAPALPSVLPAPSLPVPQAPSPPKPLPPGAPKNVRFGVVLFRYRGAELSPFDARSKADALAAAKGVIELARRDFKAAVKQGDPGSAEDTGRIGRNILEPSVEYELFTLAPGSVSEPIDTPRGYWVARRIE